jgi:hypothetical protein
MPHDQFLRVMNEQIELTHKLFDQINEDDLLNKEVVYPWGGKLRLVKLLFRQVLNF